MVAMAILNKVKVQTACVKPLHLSGFAHTSSSGSLQTTILHRTDQFRMVQCVLTLAFFSKFEAFGCSLNAGGGAGRVVCRGSDGRDSCSLPWAPSVRGPQSSA